MAKESVKKQKKVDRVRRLLKSPHAHIRALMSVLHPTEIAQVLEDTTPAIQERIVKELPKELISEAISEMDALGLALRLGANAEVGGAGGKMTGLKNLLVDLDGLGQTDKGAQLLRECRRFQVDMHGGQSKSDGKRGKLSTLIIFLMLSFQMKYCWNLLASG